MQGIAAITANNGWAMAAVGASIVITGLATLSFIISQLHKLVALMEAKEISVNHDKSGGIPAANLNAADAEILTDLSAAARIYKPLTAGLGEQFKLSNLYEALATANVPHPHITVRELRDAGYLAPAGEGFFSWKTV